MSTLTDNLDAITQRTCNMGTLAVELPYRAEAQRFGIARTVFRIMPGDDYADAYLEGWEFFDAEGSPINEGEAFDQFEEYVVENRMDLTQTLYYDKGLNVVRGEFDKNNGTIDYTVTTSEIAATEDKFLALLREVNDLAGM